MGTIPAAPAAPDPPAFRPDLGGDTPPAIYVNALRVGAAVGGKASVALPLADDRAARLVFGEAHHFARDQANVVVVDMGRAAAGGWSRWPPLIQRQLQPTRNRRLGAVALYSGFLNFGTNTISRRWSVLSNPHALRPVPPSLVGGLTSLDEGWPA